VEQIIDRIMKGMLRTNEERTKGVVSTASGAAWCGGEGGLGGRWLRWGWRRMRVEGGQKK